ncbi:MAG: spore germination protein GerW family protein [Anaerolineae bacterium]
MTPTLDGLMVEAVKSREEGMRLLDRVMAVAEPGAVFAAPVHAGDYTLITASEVTLGMGFGFAFGGGPQEGKSQSAAPKVNGSEEPEGLGGGGGGGGGSAGRPVAVITIGPEGVRVEPVVDASKIAVTLLTVLAGMAVTLSHIRRAAHRA